MGLEVAEWTRADARGFVRVPLPSDDKYAHGVLGVATGSERYPGAAVLGVDAAYATGVGMVRYVGPPRVSDLVLTRRPEAVLGPGRVDAWLVGSGMDWLDRLEPVHSTNKGGGSILDPDLTDEQRVLLAVTSGLPVVMDAGALPALAVVKGPAIATPHAGELARLTGRPRDGIEAHPLDHARHMADEYGTVVVLKGHTTLIVGPGTGERFESRVTAPTTWLATAGTGDVLAGIIGALVASHASLLASSPEALAPLAATGCLIHGLAGALAGGPLGASDIVPRIAPTIAGIV